MFSLWIIASYNKVLLFTFKKPGFIVKVICLRKVNPSVVLPKTDQTVYMWKIISIPHTFITYYAIGSLPFCCLGKKARRNTFISFKTPMLGGSLYRPLGTSIESHSPESSHTAFMNGFRAIETQFLFVPQGGTKWLWPFSVSTEFCRKDHDLYILLLTHFLKCVLRWSCWTVSV